MKTFHITWIKGYTEEGYPMSTGVNIQAKTMNEALNQFTSTHPHVEPLYIAILK